MPYMDDDMLDLFGEDAVGGELSNDLIQPLMESQALIERVDQAHHSGRCQ
jgi:hypothetical protein